MSNRGQSKALGKDIQSDDTLVVVASQGSQDRRKKWEEKREGLNDVTNLVGASGVPRNSALVIRDGGIPQTSNLHNSQQPFYHDARPLGEMGLGFYGAAREKPSVDRGMLGHALGDDNEFEFNITTRKMCLFLHNSS